MTVLKIFKLLVVFSPCIQKNMYFYAFLIISVNKSKINKQSPPFITDLVNVAKFAGGEI